MDAKHLRDLCWLNLVHVVHDICAAPIVCTLDEDGGFKRVALDNKKIDLLNSRIDLLIQLEHEYQASSDL